MMPKSETNRKKETIEVPKCEKHGIPKEYVLVMESQPYEDEDGNLKETGDMYQWQCPIYEDEIQFSAFEEGPDAERFLNKKITDFKNENPEFVPHGNMNIITKLMDLYEDTDATENPRKAMAHFVISSCLHNAKSANSKGKILPNLGFMWAEPSGVNKTPLLVAGVDNFEKPLFSTHLRYETGTAKGVKKSLAKYYRDGEDQRFSSMVTWDEAQDIIQMMRQESLADIYSFFCQLVDNRLQSYHSIRGGKNDTQLSIPPSGCPEFPSS
jgi:hypothetical protein